MKTKDLMNTLRCMRNYHINFKEVEMQVKKVVFISNFFNHHQKPLSDAFFGELKSGYVFIETEPMSEERKNMGWGMNNYPEYVVNSETFYKNKNHYIKVVNDADAVIIGSAPEVLIKERKKNKKLIFRYSERPLKKGLEILKYPLRFVRWHLNNHPQKNIYMLCASAYTAKDYAKFGLFKNKCYKYGYFPETREYSDLDLMIDSKEKQSILWVARLIDWKHPEAAIEVAKRLKADGYSFDLNIIGVGEMEDYIRDRIENENLGNEVHMLGSKTPDEVRTYMEKSQIFLMTSDRQEGWGAVLNESMNSACAVVANKALGAAPYLIEDNKSGFLYRDGDMDDLYSKVKLLLDNSEKRKEFGMNAYKTIVEHWNADNAVHRTIALFDAILSEKKRQDIFENGLCSKADK